MDFAIYLIYACIYISHTYDYNHTMEIRVFFVLDSFCYFFLSFKGNVIDESLDMINYFSVIFAMI